MYQNYLFTGLLLLKILYSLLVYNNVFSTGINNISEYDNWFYLAIDKFCLWFVNRKITAGKLIDRVKIIAFVCSSLLPGSINHLNPCQYLGNNVCSIWKEKKMSFRRILIKLPRVYKRFVIIHYTIYYIY